MYSLYGNLYLSAICKCIVSMVTYIYLPYANVVSMVTYIYLPYANV